MSEKGEFFGEMAILGQNVRGATVRALGHARVLTVDKKNLLGGIHKDPSLAFHLLEAMSNRIRVMNAEMSQLKLAS